MIDTKGFSAVEKFEEISSRTEKRFEQLGLEPDEVKEAVGWVREVRSGVLSAEERAEQTA